jgi:hypothetical protein
MRPHSNLLRNAHRYMQLAHYVCAVLVNYHHAIAAVPASQYQRSEEEAGYAITR